MQLRSRKAVEQQVAQELHRHKVGDSRQARVVTFTEVERRHLRSGGPRATDPLRVHRSTSCWSSSATSPRSTRSRGRTRSSRW